MALTTEARLVVSKWDPSVPQAEPVLTFLDRLATQRNVHYELGSPANFRALVPADSPEINILHDDNFTGSALGEFPADYPLLHEGVRLLTYFRLEDQNVWRPRFRGPILGTEDVSDSDVPLTRFQAYDPWAYLDHRPCLRCVKDPADPFVCDLDGNGNPVVNPVPSGNLRFAAGTELQYIVGELLRRTISANGPAMIDAGDGTSANGDGNDYGGTADWAGTIETCATLTNDWVIQDGTMVGEAWRAVVDSGLLAIILTPVFDVNRPGICADLSIYQTDSDRNGLDEKQFASSFLNFPCFFWDRSGHDVSDIQRTVNGLDRANKIQFRSSEGVPIGTQTGTSAVTRYGEYWAQEEVVRWAGDNATRAAAQKERYIREIGRRLYQVSPVPEFTVRPFQDYDLGTYAQLYHSSRLRQEQAPYGLITAFDLDLSDLGVETVSGMLVDVAASDASFAVDPP